MKVKDTKKSWSKYGTFDSKLFKIEKEWFCQACTDKMPNIIDPFLIPFGIEGIANEYLRLCPSCYNKLKTNDLTYFELVIKVRNVY